MQSVERNGVKLFFREARGARAPAVLIHGWCCDHSYLAPQFEHQQHQFFVISRTFSTETRAKPAAPCRSIVSAIGAQLMLSSAHDHCP